MIQFESNVQETDIKQAGLVLRRYNLSSETQTS